jgi:hypothetical protein
MVRVFCCLFVEFGGVCWILDAWAYPGESRHFQNNLSWSENMTQISRTSWIRPCICMTVVKVQKLILLSIPSIFTSRLPQMKAIIVNGWNAMLWINSQKFRRQLLLLEEIHFLNLYRKNQQKSEIKSQ